MRREQAISLARKMWRGKAWIISDSRGIGPAYQVGFKNELGLFECVGQGSSWESAFEDAKLNPAEWFWKKQI